MKNRILTFIFCVISILTFAQKPSFKIKYSEQLAVFVFIQELSDNSSENVFKSEFLKSKYNVEKYQKIISDFKKLNIYYGYTFEEYPYASKKSMQTENLLRKNLIETESIIDFKIRSIGLIPNKTLTDLSKYISEFTPIYNELIYNPNKEKFENQLEKIKKYSNERQIENYFKMGLHFYNSSWDSSIPFEVAFYPLPNSNGFTAESFCNNFISAIQTDLISYKDLFSTMLHETYHIVYDEQTVEVKTEISTYFKENKSKCSNYAYLLLNEILATTLGNGYVFEKLYSKIDTRIWYNNKYVNLLAKEIYPLVKEYINQKKPIDKNFIDNYIKLYENNFPNWINELDNIMTYRYTVSENENDFNEVKKMFPNRTKAEYDNQITENIIEKMQKTPFTKLVIISKNSEEKLKMLKKKFKELKNIKLYSDKEFAYKILLNDKSQFIILNQKKSSIETLIKSIK